RHAHRAQSGGRRIPDAAVWGGGVCKPPDAAGHGSDTRRKPPDARPAGVPRVCAAGGPHTQNAACRLCDWQQRWRRGRGRGVRRCERAAGRPRYAHAHANARLCRACAQAARHGGDHEGVSGNERVSAHVHRPL
ncbi:hypothetical protein H4R21_006706, partial [Coemansia helicoidea]